MKVKSESEVALPFLTLSNPKEGRSLPGSAVHGIFQAKSGEGCHCLLLAGILETAKLLEQEDVQIF